MYTCTNPLCGLDFGRQRKLDLKRLVCGGCKSCLTQTKPVPKTTSGKENKPNPFGMFVKEHFADIKEKNPGLPHKEIMRILSKQYREKKNCVSDESSTNERETISLLEDSEDDIEEVVTSIGILNLR
jgi:hypothetical protein